MSVVVGIDIGTTSAKAAAYDDAGRETAGAEIGYPLHEPQPGHAEQDPGTVVEVALDVTRRAVDGARRAGLDVAGLALSGAMHGLVGLDAHGQPVTPLLTWADTRAAAQAERLRADHPHLHGRTGTPPHPMSPLAKLLWLREREPETVRRSARWCGIKELVVHRLTGAWATDVSTASGTGLLDLRALSWDAEALALAGIDAAALCPLHACTHVLPLTADVGLPAGTPVVLGAGDGPLANVGVGAVRPGVAACSIGTSGALRLVVERPQVDPLGRTFCFALTPGRWVVGGAINNGGSVLRWAGAALTPDLGDEPAAALLELAARAPAGSGGLLMLPALHGERAPHWSTVSRGAYVGLTSAHRREHLVRAALEGVCQQLALVLGAMRQADYEVREIRATGGFARSPLWRQMLADVLGMPISVPAGHQGSAFGAALLGMTALGLVDDLDHAADLVRIADRVEPDEPAAATYAAMRPAFAALHDALTPAFRMLRDLPREPGRRSEG